MACGAHVELAAGPRRVGLKGQASLDLASEATGEENIHFHASLTLASQHKATKESRNEEEDAMGGWRKGSKFTHT